MNRGISNFKKPLKFELDTEKLLKFNTKREKSNSGVFSSICTAAA